MLSGYDLKSKKSFYLMGMIVSSSMAFTTQGLPKLMTETSSVKVTPNIGTAYFTCGRNVCSVQYKSKRASERRVGVD